MSWWKTIPFTAVLRHMLYQKNEPEVPQHFLVSSYTVEYGINQQKIFCGAHLDKTYIWVILYFKIDHFSPLKRNFHPFPALWPYFLVWNLLLSNSYHLLVQVRHARNLFFPLGTNDWAKSKPRCKKMQHFWK